jgi:hypothetical protein
MNRIGYVFYYSKLLCRLDSPHPRGKAQSKKGGIKKSS